jgi:hypothetical protein
MNTTYLSLYFYDNADPKIFFIQDVSNYNPDIEITHRYLTITPPNFSQSYTVEYPKHSLIPINSNVFGWTNTMTYSQLKDLPDGLYKLQQSVDPNCLVKRDYVYFRITSLKTRILSKISDSFSINASCFDCSKDDSWYKDLFQYLQWLETAKYMAECENKQEEAKIIYNSVLSKLLQSDC